MKNQLTLENRQVHMLFGVVFLFLAGYALRFVYKRQSVRNLVENINAASRRKQRIYSAPSMCCEEKKEHFSPSSEHRHVSSHRVAY